MELFHNGSGTDDVNEVFSPRRRHVLSRAGWEWRERRKEDDERGMPPVKTREPLIEEKVFGGIAKGWAYLVYAIRQVIIFFPCLWAGYEYGRRKEERMKKLGKQVGRGESSEAHEGKTGLCAIHRVNWTEVEELWDLDVETVDAVIEDILEEAFSLLGEETTTSQ